MAANHLTTSPIVNVYCQCPPPELLARGGGLGGESPNASIVLDHRTLSGSGHVRRGARGRVRCHQPMARHSLRVQGRWDVAQATQTPSGGGLSSIRIAVVSMQGMPLSPTTPAKARKLLRRGGAMPKRDQLGTFYLQLTSSVGNAIPHDTVARNRSGQAVCGRRCPNTASHTLDGTPRAPVSSGQKGHEDAMAARAISPLSQDPPAPDVLSASYEA